MATPTHRTIVLGAVVGAAAGLVGVVAKVSFDFSQSLFTRLPIEYHSTKVVSPSPIRPGTAVKFAVTRTKHRMCGAVYDRFIVKRGDDNVTHLIYRDTVPGGFSTERFGTVTFSIKLPDDLSQGFYCLVQTAKLLCHGGDVPVLSAPEVCFEVSK